MSQELEERLEKLRKEVDTLLTMAKEDRRPNGVTKAINNYQLNAEDRKEIKKYIENLERIKGKYIENLERIKGKYCQVRDNLFRGKSAPWWNDEQYKNQYSAGLRDIRSR